MLSHNGQPPLFAPAVFAAGGCVQPLVIRIDSARDGL